MPTKAPPAVRSGTDCTSLASHQNNQETGGTMSDAALAASPNANTPAPTLLESAGNAPRLTQLTLHNDSGAQA